MKTFGKYECKDKYATGEKRFQHLLKREQALITQNSQQEKVKDFSNI
jgi:hypothetical protein